jgi:putative toxin-antitoxin system antitoxin component (TIGR02293 family)
LREKILSGNLQNQKNDHIFVTNVSRMSPLSKKIKKPSSDVQSLLPKKGLKTYKLVSSKKDQNIVAESSPAYSFSPQMYSNSGEFVLLNVIRNGIGYSEFEKIKNKCSFSPAEWATFLDLSERTIARYAQQNENFDKKVSERILEIAMLFERGEEVMSNLEAFNDWMNLPNVALGEIPPKSLLDSSIGINILRNILGRIEYGIPS